MEKPDDKNEQSESPKIGQIQPEGVENDEKKSNKISENIGSVQEKMEQIGKQQESLQKSVDDIREKQEAQIEKIIEILEKQTEQNMEIYKNLEDIQDIREKQETLLEMFEKMQETKRVQIHIPAPEKSGAFELCRGMFIQGSKPTSGKEFVLKYVFKDVSKMVEGVNYYSDNEEHFGVPWKFRVSHEKEHISYILFCDQDKNEKEEWAIEIWRDMRIYSTNGEFHSKSREVVFKSNGRGWGWHEFLKWDDLMKDYVIDDSIHTEVHVKIIKMSGIGKKKLRMFDASNECFSDVVLIIGEEKFYVSKLFLANQSNYFKALILGQFQESQKTEITLNGIDCDDFQKYLEVLYGHYAIDGSFENFEFGVSCQIILESSVEGILLIADMYDTQIVIEKCEEFLMEKSKKSMKKKLKLAKRYNLDELKENCLSEIKTLSQFKAVIKGNIRDMDHSIIADLLEKVSSFPY